MNKTIKYTFAVLILSLFAFSFLITSCGGSDDDAPTPTPAPAPTPVSTNDNFIRCKIDGVSYEATGAQIVADQNELAFNIRSFNSASGIEGMDFSIMGQAVVGTYSFNSSNLTTVGKLQYRSPTIIFSSAKCTSTGTLTITAKNGNTIEGTFSFTGKNLIALCSEPTKTISEGTFKITLL
jgi:hypothetical protein